MLKKFTLGCFAFLAFSAGLKAQISVQNQTNNVTTIDFTNGLYLLESFESGAGSSTKIIDKNTTPMLELGNPDLGKYAFSLVLPASGTPQISVEPGIFTEYTDITILPSKGSLKRNINPSDVPYTYNETYSTNSFFPAKRAVINDPFIFRNVRGASVHVYPYAYNPVTKILRVYHKMKITVSTSSDKTGVNTLAANNFESNLTPFYKNLFLNYTESNVNQQRYTPIEEKGKMLIITEPSCTTAIQPLVDWKMQRGIVTEVVTTTTAGNTQAAIAAYIQAYYTANPSLMFVLLVGDHEQLPAFNAGTSGSETKWSDSKYGMLSGSDWYPEVLMGRLPAKNSTHATSMVTKILEYEKTPLAGTWYTNSIGIGSDEGAGIGDDGEPDWQHMRNIRTELMAFGYTTVHEFYDASHGGADAAGNPTNTMVASAVETGASLFLYCGHGSTGTCVTSNYSNSDINAATNYGKYPFVISVACNNGTFPGGECLTETFMRASNTGGPTGAIGAAGSSILMAWAEPMETQDEMSKILTEIEIGNLKNTLGGLFYNSQFSMLEKYNTVTGREVMETWVLFGDPSTMIRSKVPATMAVTPPSCYTNGGTLTVTGGIDGADVALTQGSVLLGAGEISGSSATLNVTGATTAAATLTVSGYNQLPYTISLAACASSVKELNVLGVNVYPNPATDVLYIENGTGFNYSITDASGKIIANGLYTNPLNVNEFSKGLYFIRVTDLNNDVHIARFIKK
jgi:gingipain R